VCSGRCGSPGFCGSPPPGTVGIVGAPVLGGGTGLVRAGAATEEEDTGAVPPPVVSGVPADVAELRGAGGAEGAAGDVPPGASGAGFAEL
jgi:hypothetical protein